MRNELVEKLEVEIEIERTLFNNQQFSKLQAISKTRVSVSSKKVRKMLQGRKKIR